MSSQTLRNICINTVIEKKLDYLNCVPLHIEEEIDMLKHKNKMKNTLSYFYKIQKWTSDKSDVIIKNVRFLPSQDFFSYDHLIVRYANKFGNSFTFIQM
jgi:hypothetical protein